MACTGITRCVTSHPVTRNTHISSLMTWPELAGLAGSGITRVLILLLLNAPCSVAGRTGLYFMCVTYGKFPMHCVYACGT